jgi:methyl-accepting chemotaxis protein
MLILGKLERSIFRLKQDKGRRFIIVELGSANSIMNLLELQASRTAFYTLLLLLVTTFVTGFFVWRFTRPISELSVAARKVAGGDFDVQVDSERGDEMGTLAAAFNEMTARLGRARELEMQLHQARKVQSLDASPPRSPTRSGIRSITSISRSIICALLSLQLTRPSAKRS